MAKWAVVLCANCGCQVVVPYEVRTRKQYCDDCAVEASVRDLRKLRPSSVTNRARWYMDHNNAPEAEAMLKNYCDGCFGTGATSGNCRECPVDACLSEILR